MIELIGRITLDGGLPVNELLLHHVHRELQRRKRRALAVTSLEHEYFTILNRELKILHVFEMLFQRGANFFQFSKRRRHVIRQLRDWFRCADTGDDIFALRVDEKFAVEFFIAIGRISRERDA